MQYKDFLHCCLNYNSIVWIHPFRMAQYNLCWLVRYNIIYISCVSIADVLDDFRILFQRLCLCCRLLDIFYVNFVWVYTYSQHSGCREFIIILIDVGIILSSHAFYALFVVVDFLLVVLPLYMSYMFLRFYNQDSSFALSFYGNLYLSGSNISGWSVNFRINIFFWNFLTLTNLATISCEPFIHQYTKIKLGTNSSIIISFMLGYIKFMS